MIMVMMSAIEMAASSLEYQRVLVSVLIREEPRDNTRRARNQGHWSVNRPMIVRNI